MVLKFVTLKMVIPAKGESSFFNTLDIEEKLDARLRERDVM